MKLTVLGGGGVRTPFLVKALAQNAGAVGLTEIALLDKSANKLETYGKLALEITKLVASDLHITTSTNAEEAFSGADYIISTVRVGGDEARLFDEQTCISHGVLGQETTGGGGFAMALRSIPVIAEYMEIARKCAKPGCITFNFTNPSGIITQALRDLGHEQVYGICDAPSEFFKQLRSLLDKPSQELNVRAFGLNHLSWFDNFKLDGLDITEKLLNDPRLYTDTEMRLFDPDLIRLGGGMMPNEYLYFYHYPEKTRNAIANATETRTQTILRINRETEAKLREVDVDKDPEAAFACYLNGHNQRENSYFAVESGQRRKQQAAEPSLREFAQTPDSGSYAGVAISFIQAKSSGKSSRVVLSLPNNGSIEGLQESDVAELSCTVDRDGAKPDFIGVVPPMQMNLIRQVKLFERLTITAALEHDRDCAVAALMAHPLIASYPIAKSLADIFFKQYVIS